MKQLMLIAASMFVALPAFADDSQRFDIDTYLAMQSISGITVSPDGAYIAYTLSGNDLDNDSTKSAVWMQPTTGGEPLRMTAASSSAWSPKWSPDNRYLAVLSGREGKRTQVWLLDRRGGDAQQLTDFRQGVRSFDWAPDGERMLLRVKDPAPADLDEVPRPNPRPYVIDRLQFKRDYAGYLDRRRTHIYIIDLADRNARQVTFGEFDNSGPAWSPDGDHIVFVSNRTDTPDRNRNTDLWRIDTSGDQPVAEQLTDARYADSSPVFSPDGKRLAYISNVSDGLPIYAIPQLSILDLETGESRLVESLAEVQVYAHKFTDDGRAILAIAEFRGEQQLVKVDVESGAVQGLIERENSVRSFDVANDGQIYAVVSRPEAPPEIFRFGRKGLEPLSAINRDVVAGIEFGAAKKYSHEVADGSEIDTFVMLPPGYEKGQRYPAVLHIHGGPWAQWSYSFNSESQLLAAQGYVVVMPNPRGSFGYGQAFTDALTGDWGNIDYGDVMSAMDFAIEEGWVDADRMAVYGWSYGGFLTNHIITKTTRFKAAISGAGETMVAANYGHDEWQRLWEEEFGFPWLEENRPRYDHVSAFYSLDNVTTPTLVVGGEDDWNMPIQNSEQLYAVLKRRGVPTQLVVYPGQHHSRSIPSYERDLYERYFAWLDKYVPE